MEDLVAAKVMDNAGKWYGFMTWGRIVDKNGDAWVEQAIRSFAQQTAIEGIADIHICASLREVMHCQYFHEALFSFANKGIPFGPEHEAWRRQRLEEFERGQLPVYFLGADLRQ